MIVPKGFLPSEDTAQLRGTTEAAEGTSFERMFRAAAGRGGDRAAGQNIAGFMSSARAAAVAAT